MSKSFKVELTTADKFWTPKGLGSVGMDPYRAISELVANSLDWRRLPKDKVEPIIEVIIGNNVVEIRDNGVGMTPKQLNDALQLSVASDKRRANLRVRKGMFGMGMKVACFSLGWHIKIVTRSIEYQDTDNVLALNTRLFDHTEDENRREMVTGLQINKNLQGPLDNWQSGTSILIQDLNNKYLQPIAVRDTLQEVFRPEIGVEGINIKVIDIESKIEYICEQASVPVFENYTINLDELNIKIKDDDGVEKKLRGWLGLMKSAGSGTGKWGLHLFKDNQVIERFHQTPARGLGGLMPKNPHPNYARTFGEVHLDMCKPNFHKVGFDYTTESWQQVRDALSEHIDKIMNASSEYRVSDEKKAHKALKRIQQHKKATKRAISKIKEQQKDTNKPENAISLPTGEWFIIVEPIAESFGANSYYRPWRYHFREESKELIIVINESSTIYENYVNVSFKDDIMQLVVNWAVSDCMMLFLHDRFGYDIQDAIKFRDDQLLKLFTVEG